MSEELEKIKLDYGALYRLIGFLAYKNGGEIIVKKSEFFDMPNGNCTITRSKPDCNEEEEITHIRFWSR